MNIFIQILSLLLCIGYCDTASAITLGTKYKAALQKAAMHRMPQAEQYTDTTKPTIDIEPIEPKETITEQKPLYKPIYTQPYTPKYIPQQKTNLWNMITSLWNSWL